MNQSLTTKLESRWRLDLQIFRFHDFCLLITIRQIDRLNVIERNFISSSYI